MALTTIGFDEIDENHINELIQAERPESLYIEYKRESYGGADADHAEFLADISSFANAAGGDLVIGVDAPEGVPTTIIPFTRDADAEIRRLESIARSGLEARIPNLRLRAVPLNGGGNLLLIRVPRSFLLPHRINYKGRNRFWARSSAGKYEPNVQELRQLFTEAPHILQRVREFRENRLAQIRLGHLPVNMVAETLMVVHLVPLSAFELVQSFSLADVEKQCGNFGPLGRPRPTHWEITFDGFLGLSNADPLPLHHASYVQVFRNGMIEGVSTIERDYDHERNAVQATTIERYCIGSTFNWSKGLSACGVQPPYVALVSLLGTQDRMMMPGITGERTGRVITSAELHFSEVMIDTLVASPQEHAKLLRRPFMEQLWNTAGYISPPTLQADGTWALYL